MTPGRPLFKSSPRIRKSSMYLNTIRPPFGGRRSIILMPVGFILRWRGFYFGFGAGIPMGLYFGGGWGGWGGWGWQPGWGGHNIIVNNNFLHRYNFNAGRGGSLSGRSTGPTMPPIVKAYPMRRTRCPAVMAAPPVKTCKPGPGADAVSGRQLLSPPASEWATGRFRTIRAGANRSAFGGVREGGAARTHSDHGFSSPRSFAKRREGVDSSGGGGGGARWRWWTPIGANENDDQNQFN